MINYFLLAFILLLLALGTLPKLVVLLIGILLGILLMRKLKWKS